MQMSNIALSISEHFFCGMVGVGQTLQQMFALGNRSFHYARQLIPDQARIVIRYYVACIKERLWQICLVTTLFEKMLIMLSLLSQTSVSKYTLKCLNDT